MQHNTTNFAGIYVKIPARYRFKHVEGLTMEELSLYNGLRLIT